MVEVNMSPYGETDGVRLGLQKQAFKLATYSLVFQGLMFGCVYRASPDINCRQRWAPLTLSLLAGFMYMSVLCRIAFQHKSRVARDHSTPESFLMKFSRLWRWLYVGFCVCAVVGLFVGMIVVGWSVDCGQT